MSIKKVTTQQGAQKFTSASARAASAYKRVNVDTAFSSTNPHQIVVMLFDAVLTSVGSARMALSQKDVLAEGLHISKAVRLIGEGLLVSLDMDAGGPLVVNLKNVFDYCITRLTYANLHDDDAALEEVARLIKVVADAWKNNQGQGLSSLANTQ